LVEERLACAHHNGLAVSFAMAAPLAALAVSSRANSFIQAWRTRKWLALDSYPAPPTSLSEMYDTHLAIQQHPAVNSEFGGLAGYKLGAVGALGETCLYAPLFGRYLVDAPGDRLSAASINLWQIEPEIGFVLNADLAARSDGRPHSAAAAWAAVSEVVLCIECCGKRRALDDATISGLGGFADTLSSGGVVFGPRFPAASVTVDATLCATALHVNDREVATGSGTATPLGSPAEA